MADDQQSIEQPRPGGHRKVKLCSKADASASGLLAHTAEQAATPAPKTIPARETITAQKTASPPKPSPVPADSFYGLFQASFAEASEQRPATLRDYFGGMPPRAWLEKYDDPATPHDPYHELRDEFRLVLKAYPACLAPGLRPSFGLKQQLDNDGDLKALEAVQRLALEVLREFAEQPDFATLARETQQRVLGAAEALARELGEAAAENIDDLDTEAEVESGGCRPRLSLEEERQAVVQGLAARYPGKKHRRPSCMKGALQAVISKRDDLRFYSQADQARLIERFKKKVFFDSLWEESRTLFV